MVKPPRGMIAAAPVQIGFCRAIWSNADTFMAFLAICVNRPKLCGPDFVPTEQAKFPKSSSGPASLSGEGARGSFPVLAALCLYGTVPPGDACGLAGHHRTKAKYGPIPASCRGQRAALGKMHLGDTRYLVGSTAWSVPFLGRTSLCGTRTMGERDLKGNT